MNKLLSSGLSLLIVLISISACQPRFEKEILVSEVQEHINFLASDSLKGRYPGTDEDKVLADYLTGEMKQAGLNLFEKTGIQSFPIVTSIKSGNNNSFSHNNHSYSMGTDFQPMPYTSNEQISAEVIFAGYGFQFSNDTLSWDDYKDLDVQGKIVMILRGNPDPNNTKSAFVNYSEDRGKVLLASDLDAACVILVSGAKFDPADKLTILKGKEHRVSIPVIHMKRDIADSILLSSGSPVLTNLEDELIADQKPKSFATNQTVKISTDIQPENVETFNTIAIINGSDPELRTEYVVIGAHHDHLGWGGFGSGSRKPDTTAVHYGADDNASGVAAVLEIAEKLVSLTPDRSIMFTTFGAEEMGLIGSRYLVENSPIDLTDVQVMINVDMVGRLNEDRQLQISGVGTSPLFEEILDSLNLTYEFNLKLSSEGYGPSDHASFYAKDVPVLFISTGAHTDYHTPEDSKEKINYTGCVEVYSFVSDLAQTLANYPEKIAFTEAGPKVRASSKGRHGGITLGIMPDMNYDGDEGMPVLFVTEGKPAAAGSMKKGDIITAIEGKKVGNIYDYMSRLGQLKEGQSLIVTVIRDGATIDLLIQL